MEAHPSARRPDVPVAALFWLGGLILAWGCGWPAMKYVVSEMPIFSFRAVTGWAGAVCVFGLALAKGQRLTVAPGEWRVLAIASLFNVTGWSYFTALGLTLLPAGRASVLAYTMPLWAILAGRIFVRDPITRHKVIGLTLGMGAVALLLGDDIVRLSGNPAGVLAILGAAASWGVGTIIQKREWRTPVLTIAAWQLLIGGTPMVVLALFQESAPFAQMTASGWLALVYVLLIATLFGYWAWFSIVRLVPTSVASLAVLPIPLVGVTSSALMLGERIGWPELGALILITGALATVLPTPDWLLRRRPGSRSSDPPTGAAAP